jgi:hypothetical protein
MIIAHYKPDVVDLHQKSKIYIRRVGVPWTTASMRGIGMTAENQQQG